MLKIEEAGFDKVSTLKYTKSIHKTLIHPSNEEANENIFDIKALSDYMGY
ncbi:MAG: hypothetical protein ACXWD4_07455 [Bacteroidia bacterium]